MICGRFFALCSLKFFQHPLKFCNCFPKFVRGAPPKSPAHALVCSTATTTCFYSLPTKCTWEGGLNFEVRMCCAGIGSQCLERSVLQQHLLVLTHLPVAKILYFEWYCMFDSITFSYHWVLNSDLTLQLSKSAFLHLERFEKFEFLFFSLFMRVRIFAYANESALWTRHIHRSVVRISIRKSVFFNHCTNLNKFEGLVTYDS